MVNRWTESSRLSKICHSSELRYRVMSVVRPRKNLEAMKSFNNIINFSVNHAGQGFKKMSSHDTSITITTSIHNLFLGVISNNYFSETASKRSTLS